MEKKYISPASTVFCYEMEHEMLLSSPGLKDEIGGEQLSNEHSGWDAPEWAAEEE